MAVNFKYRADIDALRGLSILVVVLFHAFPEQFPGGFIGVDVFFVISGFLITSIIRQQLHSGSFTFSGFYAKRIRRIFPPLLFHLAITLCLGWFFLFPEELQQLGTHVFKTQLFIQNFQLISEEGYFNVSSDYKPLLHMWSLSIEEQFYFFWPLVMFVLSSRKMKVSYSIFIITLSFFCLNVYAVKAFPDQLYYNSLARFWEIAIGGLLATLKLPTPKRQSFKLMSFFAGVFLIVLGTFYISKSTLYHSWKGLFPTMGAALIIISHWQPKRWFGFLTLGKYSYSWYLWHWTALSFAFIYSGRQISVLAKILVVSITFLIAIFSTEFIERVRYSKSKLVVPLLILLSVAIGAIGFTFQDEKGWPHRAHLSYLKDYSSDFVREAPIDEECESYIKRSSPTEKRLFQYCRYDNRNLDKTIALIGDSHAHAFFPGLSQIAGENGYNAILLANSSCPTYLGFMFGESEDERVDCQKRIRQILNAVASDPTISKVMIVTRGPSYMHGELKGEITEKKVLKGLSTWTDQPRMNYSAYAKTLLKTLSLIQKNKNIKNVYYLLENPELGFLPKEKISRPFDIFELSKNNFMVSKDLFELRMSKYKKAVLGVQQKVSNFDVLDTKEILCPGEYCKLYDGKRSLYQDGDHFSAYGSIFVAKKLESQIF